MCVCVCLTERGRKRLDLENLYAMTKRVSSLCQERYICRFPRTDNVKAAKNFPSNEPRANQLTHSLGTHRLSLHGLASGDDVQYFKGNS